MLPVILLLFFNASVNCLFDSVEWAGMYDWLSDLNFGYNVYIYVLCWSFMQSNLYVHTHIASNVDQK